MTILFLHGWYSVPGGRLANPEPLKAMLDAFERLHATRASILDHPAISGRYLFPQSWIVNDPFIIKVVMMQRDTNPNGTIFGGVLLSYIDQAGALGAYHKIRKAGTGRKSIVTVEGRRIS